MMQMFSELETVLDMLVRSGDLLDGGMPKGLALVHSHNVGMWQLRLREIRRRHLDSI